MRKKKYFSFPYSLIPLSLIPLSLIPLSLIPLSLAFGAEKYGIISYVRGDVTLRRAETRRFIPAQGKEFVYLGDSIKTGARSQAAVLLTDGAEVKINERSLVSMDKVIDRDASGAQRFIRSMFMEFGQSWTKLFHGKGGGPMAIHSYTAVCAVRGTEAAVTVTPAKKKKIKVKVKKSELLKHGLEETKKKLKEAYEKEAREKRAVELAAKLAEDQRRQAEAGAKAAEDARKAAEEAVKKREEEIKKAGDKEEVIEKEIQEQRMDVMVLEGFIQVTNDQGTQDVRAGQALKVAAGAAPEPARDMKEEEKPKWQEDIKIKEEDKAALAKELGADTTDYAKEVKPGATQYTPAPGEKQTDEKTLNVEIEKEDGAKQKLKIRFKRK